MKTNARHTILETLLLAAVALAATYPVFVDTYRSMIFQTTPRDDYAPYLLHLVGDGGEVPGAPRSYRVLSVALAVPAYEAIPTYRFKKLNAGTDPDYLRATQALAAVSWLALAALAVLAWRTARDRFGASRPASAAVLFATVAFARYVSIAGVDPVALLLIAAAVHWFARPLAFAAIVILSVGFNEKVWIVATLLVGARILSARSLRPYRLHALACVAAIALYAGSVRYFRSAERPSLGRPILVDAPATIRMTLTPKGVAQNVLPVAIVLAAFAWTASRLHDHRGPYWSPLDVLVPLGLTAIGVAMNVEYTLGRLVFHALPLVMPPLALALDRQAVEGIAIVREPATA
jgi:hypothetical protein